MQDIVKTRLTTDLCAQIESLFRVGFRDFFPDPLASNVPSRLRFPPRNETARFSFNGRRGIDLF